MGQTFLYGGGTPLAPMNVGDTLEIRDFSHFIKQENRDCSDGWGRDGQWGIKPYLLLNGTAGKMLAVNYKTKDCDDYSGAALPPEIVIDLGLAGDYDIYVGTPILNLFPVLSGTGACGGIDIALDGEPFINVAPEYGLRCGRILAEKEREIFCYFRRARLDGRTLRLRVPFGTFHSLPLGLVRATLSCLRLVRVEANGVPASAPPKPLIVVCDGFSHYFEAAKIGECLDLRLPQAYRDSDVKILMTQISGPASWKSQITSYAGEGITEEEYQGKRRGDHRIGHYMNWAVENGQEALRRQTELCHQYGMEMHFSIRANLFFVSGNKFMSTPEKFMNGRWWMENPDARRQTKDCHKLDYAKEKTRAYYRALFSEVMERYEIDGINFDFTRWPPIFDVEKDGFDLLLTVAGEIRNMVDEFRQKTGRKLRFSMTFVEGYHSKRTLEEQKIDFERLMQAGLLDFVCVEAWNFQKYCAIAHRHGTPCYAVQDGETVYYPEGNQSDPLWVLPDGGLQDDPCAGEEFADQPDIRNFPTPQEMEMAFDRFYDAGADGVYLANHFMGELFLRDSGHPERVKRRVQSGEIYGQFNGQYLFLTK